MRVFKNRVLRKIFGLKRKEIAGDWRKLQNEDVKNFNSSPNIDRMIRSGEMRRVEHEPQERTEICKNLWL
jgi:hypothetical protein